MNVVSRGACVLLLAIGPGQSTSARVANACATKSSSPLVSPDKAFDAIVDQNYCEDGYAFMGSADYAVRVVSRTRSAHSMLVFSFDDDGYAKARPRLKWIAAEKLQITALSPAGVGVLRRSFGTVTITYRFERT